MKHLFVDISSHGFGHLAQTAPILNALHATRALRLTIRSGLAQAQLARRIHAPFTHLHEASDFGFIMQNAIWIDKSASAARYRMAFVNWSERVAAEAELLAGLGCDLVLSNIAPLPLAGAHALGIPAAAMCSLNWADLFADYFGTAGWAAHIHAALHTAYANATVFLRLTPGMPMPTLPNLQAVAPISNYTLSPPTATRREIAQRLGLNIHTHWLLLAMGGIAHRLPIESWPPLPSTQLLVPHEWNVLDRPDVATYSDDAIPFADLLPVVDAVLTKPGYGTFVEAAICGLPVLYLERPDWAEAGYLADWLHQHTRATIVTPQQAINGDLGPALEQLLSASAPPRPQTEGISAAVRILNRLLDGDGRIAG